MSIRCDLFSCFGVQTVDPTLDMDTIHIKNLEKYVLEFNQSLPFPTTDDKITEVLLAYAIKANLDKTDVSMIFEQLRFPNDEEHISAVVNK